MKLSDIAGAAGLAPEEAAIDIAGLAADSREVKPSYLFAALPGDRANGADYVSDALARGAAALLLPEGAAQPQGAVAIFDPDPRRRLALMAALFFGRQPEIAAAVTGTNGKTSVAAFTRQIWERLGHDAASLGTIGVVSKAGQKPLAHTTPDPIGLHRTLTELADAGVGRVAIEASSHGLEQRRLDGVRLSAVAFTNITRDHLDYHKDFESYFRAKLRLFELAPAGAPAIVNADIPEAARIVAAAQARGLQAWTVGRFGLALKLVSASRDGLGQRLTVRHAGRNHALRLPLAGAFQASNALVAAALAIATGGEPAAVFAALENIEGARGRLELAGRKENGASVFIDYAHTPDALEKALETLRPYAQGRLFALFGCGGDRDRGKRPQMGAIAARLADRVYVTDDNPRSEQPAAIRAEILAAAPGAVEIGDRRAAIAAAIAELGEGDVLLVAGKGHETGQIVGGEILPFSDHAAVREALGLAPEAEPDTAPAAAPPETPPPSSGEPACALPPQVAAVVASQPLPAPEVIWREAAPLAPPARHGLAPPAPAWTAGSPILAPVKTVLPGATPLWGAGDALAAPRRDELPAASAIWDEAAPIICAPRPAIAAAQQLWTVAEPLAKQAAVEPAGATPDSAEPAPQPEAEQSRKPRPLWLMEEIIAAVKGRAQGSPPRAATGVSIDTRTLAPGDLFFAIKGERSDGHGHVVEALEKGAAAAIVKRDYFGAAGPLIRVPDTLEALNALARAARARFHGRAVAVTGSAGKTGVKEMLRLALGASGEAHASDKSYNNLWGVPLSLSRLPEAASFGVFEIGMNHAGEITPLTRLVRPHVAIVTTIAPVHLEFFSGIEGIAEAKAEIFLGLEAGGVAVINRDVPQFDLLARRAREAGAAEIVSFGEHEAAEARLIEARLEPERSFVVARILGEQVEYEIGAPGRHIVMNSLSALAAAARAGASLAKAAAALGAFTPPEGRGVRAAFDAPGGRSLVIDESYNANPASVRAALAVLGHIPRADHPRRVAVLGDMLELGHAAREMHADLNGAIDEHGVDVVFACGGLMSALFEALPPERRGAYAASAEDLRASLIAGVKPGDAIMVKGSLGSRMGPLAAALKDHFRKLDGGDASG